MALTPNYSFIIPVGTDPVNLLTQCYPNFTSLDSILVPIEENGVTPATHTKVGTVHQIVRTKSMCNMFRFVATANYTTGDSFTVDGVTVTATAMDGTSIPNNAFVINQSVVAVLNNLVLTVLIAGKDTTSLPASAVTYDNTGSGLTATNAQDAIDEVVGSITSYATEFDSTFKMSKSIIYPTAGANFIMALGVTYLETNIAKTLARIHGRKVLLASGITSAGWYKVCEFPANLSVIPADIDYYGISAFTSVGGVYSASANECYLRFTTSGTVECYAECPANTDQITVVFPPVLYTVNTYSH